MSELNITTSKIEAETPVAVLHLTVICMVTQRAN